MPILESYNFKLPDENLNAPGQSVLKRVASEGFAIDKRVLTGGDIEQIYRDTIEFADENGTFPFVTIRHFDDGNSNPIENEEIHGFVKRLELRDEPDVFETDRMITLWAEMHLYPEVYAKHKEGRFPGVSIGALRNVSDSKGNTKENLLQHIAILGKQPAAIQTNNKSLLNQFYTMMDKIAGLFGLNNNNQEVSNEMPIKQMADLIPPLESMFNLNKAILESVRSLGEITDEQPKEDTPKEDEQPTETERAISPSEITKSFNALVKDGHISPDSRSDFDSLVEKTNDLQFAAKFYSKETAKTPPKGEETGSNRDESNLDDLTLAVKEQAKKFNLNPDQMKIATGEGVE